MAEYSGFFNGPQQYTQTDLARYFDNIYETGIAMLDEDTISYNCSAVEGGIKVEPGFALIKGFYNYLDEAKIIPVLPESETKRCTTFVGLDMTTKKVSVYVREGTTSYPYPIKNDTVWELMLNIFYISTDGAMKLTDRRLESYCGILRPKNLTDFNTFMNQCKQQWTKAEWEKIFVQANTPTTDLTTGNLWYQYL